MIFILSPAKSLDPKHSLAQQVRFSQPAYLDDALLLVKQLARLSPAQIGDLMNINRELAGLNHERYQSFSIPFTPDNAQQALLTFNGHSYQSFELDTFGADDFEFAQQHLRILSGLYGLLKPLDLIQPYRLEMGTRLSNKRGDSLYAFWKAQITQGLNELLAAQKGTYLINLASNEYFHAVDPEAFAGTIIQPSFREERNGTLKTISVYAKQARGAMANYAIKQRITQPEALKAFTGMGYHYNEAASTEYNWVFSRATA